MYNFLSVTHSLPKDFFQDVINRIGLRLPGSPLRSPIGSPRAIRPLHPHMMAAPNMRRPLNLAAGGAIRAMPPQRHQSMGNFSPK